MGRLFSCPQVSCGLDLSLLLLGVGPAHATLGVTYQMQLGNPSNATADTNDHNHHLIQLEVEAIDYSDTLRQPNWASWNLTIDDTGDSGRSLNFFVDTWKPTAVPSPRPEMNSSSSAARKVLAPTAPLPPVKS